MPRGIKNAKITGTFLGYEDHRILTAYLYLDYGGLSQGFGGYTLDEPIKNDKSKSIYQRRGHAFGAEFILRVLKTVGVDTWEDLVGKSLRVDCEHSKVWGIGHYLKDNWFYPQEVAFEMFPKIGQDDPDA